MFKINYAEVKPPIKSVEVTLTIEEIRIIHAALGPTSLKFCDDVGVQDGYGLWNKLGGFLLQNNIDTPLTSDWFLNKREY